MQHKAIKRGKPEIAFSIFNYIFFTLLCIVMVYPFWHVIMMSLSSVEATAKGGVFLWPKGFNLETYAKVFNDPSIWSGYFTTILVTLSGTFFGTLFTATTAYPLSKKYLPFSKAMLLLVLFTMLFSGGMIPGYLLMKNLGLIDNRLSLILPGIWSTLPVFIMTRSFEAIPDPLVEAAYLDGAGQWYTFVHVGLPLGYPGIATALMFSFVDSWNALEQPLTYLKDKNLWPIALYLPDIARDKASVAFAAALVTCLLPALVYVNCQEELEQGVAASGVKQ